MKLQLIHGVIECDQFPIQIAIVKIFIKLSREISINQSITWPTDQINSFLPSVTPSAPLFLKTHLEVEPTKQTIDFLMNRCVQKANHDLQKHLPRFNSRDHDHRLKHPYGLYAKMRSILHMSVPQSDLMIPQCSLTWPTKRSAVYKIQSPSNDEEIHLRRAIDLRFKALIKTFRTAATTHPSDHL